MPNFAVSNKSIIYIFLIALVFFLNYFAVYSQAKQPFLFSDQEEAIYHLREICAERVPYRDFFTHHFVGFLMPISFLTRSCDFSPSSYLRACASWNLVSIFFVGLIAFRSTNRVFLALMAALLAATVGWFPWLFGNTCNIQMLLFPVIYSMSYFALDVAYTKRKTSLLLCALVASVGMMLDQRLIFFTPLFFLALLVIMIDSQKTLLRARQDSVEHESAQNLFGDRVLKLSKVDKDELMGVLPDVDSRSWNELEHGKLTFRDILLIGCLLFLPWMVLATSLYLSDALEQFFFQTVLFPIKYRNYHLAESFGVDRVYELFRTEPFLLVTAIISCIALFWNKHYKELILVLLLGLSGYIAAAVGGRQFINYNLFFGPCILLSLTFLLKSSLSATNGISIFYFILIALNIAKNTYCFLESVTPKRSYLLMERTIDELRTLQSNRNNVVFVWGYAPHIYNRLNVFSPISDVSLMSISGANFSSTASSDQGFLPDNVEKLETMMRESPPDIFVYYACHDYSGGFGKALIPCNMKNLDFDKVEHLNFIRKAIGQKYERWKVIVAEGTISNIYKLKTISEPIPSGE